MNAGYSTSYYFVRGLVGNLISQILNTPLKEKVYNQSSHHAYIHMDACMHMLVQCMHT